MILLDRKKFILSLVLSLAILLGGLFLVKRATEQQIYKAQEREWEQLAGFLVNRGEEEGLELLDYIREEDKESFRPQGRAFFQQYGVNDFIMNRSDYFLHSQIALRGGVMGGFLFLLLVILSFLGLEAIKGERYVRQLNRYVDRVMDKDFSKKLPDERNTTEERMNRRLNELTRAIASNYQRLEGDSTQSRLHMQNISHQLRTPLASLRMFNDLLLDEVEIQGVSREFIEASKQQIERISWLIEGLLKLSKIASGNVIFHKEYVSFSQLTEGLEEDFYPLLSEKDLDLSIDVKGIGAQMDYEWTREALSNLVKNAAEHADPGSTIQITAVENEIYARLDVANDGERISDEDLSHLFERFYRAKNSGANSIGIGLNLTQEIMRGQGGYASARNTETGVIFRLTFLK